MSKQVERKFIETETFLHTFFMREEMHPDKVYLRQPYGDVWKEWTWAQVGDQARRMAAALHSLGLEKGDHVGILSKNCYHWIIADLAIMMVHSAARRARCSSAIEDPTDGGATAARSRKRHVVPAGDGLQLRRRTMWRTADPLVIETAQTAT